MTDSFTGEVRLMGFKFAPKGWAACDGQPMPAAQLGPLFKQIGYKFGGSGPTFNLPDLRNGQIAIGTGAGPGRTARSMGEAGGTPQVTLTMGEMPPHTHLVRAVSDPGDVTTPTAATTLARSNGAAAYATPQDIDPSKKEQKVASLDPRLVSGVRGGDNLPHENRMPFQAVFYCICLLAGSTED